MQIFFLGFQWHGLYIVDKEDIATLEAIFYAVKKQVSAATVNTLMIDDGKIG